MLRQLKFLVAMTAGYLTVVSVDVMLARRKLRPTDLSNRLGITIANLSNLKTGKARAIRFSTLEAICAMLECQPGDLLEYVPGEAGGNAEGEPDGTRAERAEPPVESERPRAPHVPVEPRVNQRPDRTTL